MFNSLVENMSLNNSELSGNTIIAIWSIFGTLIGGAIISYGTWYGTEKNNRKEKIENEKTIKELKETIINLSAENKAKTQEVLDFNTKIDANTLLIKSVVSSIEKISGNTEKISSKIKAEQSEKGMISLTPKEFENYKINFGSISVVVSIQKLINGYLVSPTNLLAPIYLKLDKGKLLISSKVYDSEMNLALEIIDGEWASNKSNNFSINYDASGLEIINNKGQIQLQLDLYDNIIRINGLFYNNDTVVLLSDGMTTMKNITDNRKKINDFMKVLERNFKHTGKDYLGTRSKKYLEIVKQKKRFQKEIQQKKQELANMDKQKFIKYCNLKVVEFSNLYLKYKKMEDEANISGSQSILANRKLVGEQFQNEFRQKYLVETYAISFELKKLLKYEISNDFKNPKMDSMGDILVMDIEDSFSSITPFYLNMYLQNIKRQIKLLK
ncbi:hypothetical protein [Maribacter sp.]|uniref:hypothetical protein n=1 Tax=Maribacter sp. TaxID=1897614 RepID=UPI0025C0B9A9|nr:hypothetical protein [Maribacter sp.]